MRFNHTNLSIENKYPKLVRDRIPELIEKNEGRKVKTKILANNTDFLLALARKTREEVAELELSIKVGNVKEELADLLELFEAITRIRAFSMAEVKEVQVKKKKERGGFEKRVLMLGKE